MESAPPSSSSTPAAAEGPSTPAAAPVLVLCPQNKRKRAPPSSAAVSLKKLKGIIDCRKAVAFLSDLGLQRAFLNSGRVLAWNLEPQEADYINILTYVSQGKHPLLHCEVIQIIRIMPNAPKLQNDATPSSFNEDPRTKNMLRKMLWHGTSSKNVHKILKNGLKLPKKNLEQYFGDGIYFSDCFGMSVCYCGDWRSGQSNFELDKDGTTKVGYLFLSDVLLGNVYKTYRLQPDAPNISVSKPGGWFWESEVKTVDSIAGCGYSKMDPAGDIKIDGCVWPLGSRVTDEERPYLADPIVGHEFVVYDEWRAMPKFLVKVKINE